MNSNLDITSIIKGFNYRDLIIGIFPILIFLVLYLSTYNPGILNADSFNLLHQIATGNFNNAIPIFYTFIVMICLKIYASPITVGIFQILVFSVMWMIICKYHRNDSDSNQFVFQFAATFIISLIPVNAVNSITLSNFTLFSYALMFLCFLIKVMVDREGKLDLKWIIIMAVTIAFVSALNNFGIYIALISLIPILAYLYFKNPNQNMLIHLSAAAIICICLLASLNIIYDVGAGQAISSQDDGINLENAKNKYFSSIHESPKESFEDVSQANLRYSHFNMINSLVNTFQDNIILNTLFNNSFVYMILGILSLAFIRTKTKSNEIFLVYAPILINIGIVLLTSPTQFNLSLYSNTLVFYLIIIILISIWFKVDLKPRASPDKPTPTREIDNTPYPIENDYESIEYEFEELTLEDVNEMLGETSEQQVQETKVPESQVQEIEVPEIQETSESDPDLVDQILKEIKMEKEDK